MLRRKHPKVNGKEASPQTFTITIKVQFTPIDSLCIPCWAAYMGGVKAAVYCEDKPNTPKPWSIQNYLNDFPVMIGRYKTKEECQNACKHLIKLHLDKLQE